MNRDNRKEKKKEREEREYNLKLKQLQTLYNNWLDTYVYGPSDGFNADEKLNWLRKQIIETKSRLTELYTKRNEQVSFLPEGQEIKPPEVMCRAIPPEIEPGFQAYAERMRYIAQEMLTAFEQSSAYRTFLTELMNLPLVERLQLDADICDIISVIKRAIEEKDWIVIGGIVLDAAGKTFQEFADFLGEKSVARLHAAAEHFITNT